MSTSLDLPYGYHETCVLEDLEMDLNTMDKVCSKNPGHKDFKSLEAFSIDNLPESHRDEDVLKLIKAVGDLTVRLAVDEVDPLRPELRPDPDIKYPSYSDGVRKKRRAGTGEMFIYKHENGQEIDASGRGYKSLLGRTADTTAVLCPCKKCGNSDAASNEWWEIFIDTASHLVQDDHEASATSCRLFYNNKDSEVVTLSNFSVDFVNVERDVCVLRCVTCEDLGKRLYKAQLEWRKVWNSVKDKFQSKAGDRIAFIVSHPHGCPKQVSVGQWLENTKFCEVDKEYDFTRLSYDTCTCPGSSGASVYCVGFGGGHVHSGTKGTGSNVNFSNVSYYRKQ
ncbi:hypothetical protein BgiBS90_028047 [Biomphalaria glabrata]|nr:hypothetical protein BgiBS90_028047 [Biomphalaria glabrata]